MTAHRKNAHAHSFGRHQFNRQPEQDGRTGAYDGKHAEGAHATGNGPYRHQRGQHDNPAITRQDRTRRPTGQYRRNMHDGTHTRASPRHRRTHPAIGQHTSFGPRQETGAPAMRSSIFRFADDNSPSFIDIHFIRDNDDKVTMECWINGQYMAARITPAEWMRNDLIFIMGGILPEEANT